MFMLMYFSLRVKTALEKLLEMPNFTLTLRLIPDKVENTLFKTIQSGGKGGRRVKLKNNIKEDSHHKYLRQVTYVKPEKREQRKRDEFLLEMMQGRIKRSQHESVTRKSKGSKSLARVSPEYWFSGPLIRTDRVEKLSPVRQMAVDKHVVHGLPDNFSWCLQYFASYAQISNVSLLQELADIENLILHLDKDFFGYMKPMKNKNHN